MKNNNRVAEPFLSFARGERRALELLWARPPWLIGPGNVEKADRKKAKPPILSTIFFIPEAGLYLFCLFFTGFPSQFRPLRSVGPETPPKAPARRPREGKALGLPLGGGGENKILHDPKDPKLWELWSIPYYGSCRILSINRMGIT